MLSVRNRILLFAVLVTLLPSIGLGWIYLSQAEKALLESSRREMLATVGQVRREFDLWFKERYYDIQVFSNSYLLSEGLEDHLRVDSEVPGREVRDDDPQLGKVESYLSIVHSEFTDYSRLVVFDGAGKLLTQSPQRNASIALPDDWREQIETKKVIVGEVSELPRGTPAVLAAVPILSGDGITLGFLGAEIKLGTLQTIMTSFLASQEARAASAELLLVKPGGKVLLSTSDQQVEAPGKVAYEDLLRPHELGEYRNSRGVAVIGALTPVSGFSWHLVMERQRDQVFSEVLELRTKAIFGVSVLVALIGFFAYLLSRGIISPLEKLTEAAGKVADGDLGVNIIVERQDELGEATRVFNEMVGQLRQSRERLEQLSTIDPLTKLSNRRYILEKLKIHLERYRRSGTPFSVLLVDADHFKRINDSAGHLVGDKVLCRLGEIFKRLLRTVDTAARYGGEEFLIILDETRCKEALQTAERIRLAVESTVVKSDETLVRFTVSIGVAEVSDGDNEDQLISRADTALYQAKREGRGRSILARSADVKVAHHPTVKKRDRS